MVIRKYMLPTLAAVTVMGITCLSARRLMISEEARIRRRFAAVASMLSVNTKQGQERAAMLKIQLSLRDFFTDPFSIDAPGTSFSADFSPAEIARQVAYFRTQFDRLTITLYNLDVRVIDDDLAESAFTAMLRGTTSSQKRVMEVREIEALLRKVDGQWLFSEIAVIKVLRR